MKHTFDPVIAKEVGIECAILLCNIEYWIEKNKANDKHFYDGRYWTYNSVKAFSELFPYMSDRVIYYSLQKLVNKGYLIKGNYNKNSFDRTCWYALGDKILGKNCAPKEQNPNSKTRKYILQNDKIQNRASENEYNETNINTNLTTDLNTNISSHFRQGENVTSPLEANEKFSTPKSEYSEDFEELWENYPRKIDKRGCYKTYLAFKKRKNLDKNKELFNRILESIKKYKLYCELERVETQFIKHFSTFLNKGSYENSYDSPKMFGSEEIKYDEEDTIF